MLLFKLFRVIATPGTYVGTSMYILVFDLKCYILVFALKCYILVFDLKCCILVFDLSCHPKESVIEWQLDY